MSIVDDLAALDLTAIVNARGSITVAADDPALQGVLSGDVGATVLGDLGTALDELRNLAAHPDALLDDVVDALPGLDAIPGLGDLDLPAWEEAVREGAQLVADLVAVLGGDYSKIGELVTGAVGDAFGSGTAALADYARVGVDELAGLRRTVEQLAAGVPLEPKVFAGLAVDILLPGASGDVLRLRAAVSGFLDGATGLKLPEGRIAGLLEAHAAIVAAPDTAAVQAALANLKRVRAETLASLDSDLRHLFSQLDGLGAAQLAQLVDAAGTGLGAARTGVLEFLGQLRTELADARTGLDALDPAELHAAVIGYLDRTEERVRELLIAPIDERVNAVEAFIRNLLAHLPLRALRAELAALVEQAVTAIEDADLDGPARELRAKLHELEQQIAGIDVGAVVREALEQVEQVINAALDTIVEALEAIGGAVEALADGAADLVDQVVGILEALAGAVQEAKAAIEALPIEQARQEVVAAIHELREKAEELLAGTSLPEGLKPLIDQLIEELRNIDVEGALLGPIDDALSQFHVLEDLGLPDMVRSVQETLSNLVPAQIADELTAQLDAVLDGIRAFRPEGLEALVRGFLGDAADAIEGVDLDPVRALVHEPFAVLLGLFDELKPSNLLAPVLAAYDDLVGSASLPDPVEATQGMMTAASDAANSLRPPTGDLAKGLLGGAAGSGPAPPLPDTMPHPGDAIRLLGWLPAKLHEALAAASAEARAAALGALHGAVGGLAGDLRSLQAAAHGAGERLDAALDTLLAPLAAAQMRAQLSLTARAGTLQIDLDASLDIVASASPAPLRAALQSPLQLVAGGASDVAARLATVESAAAALERSPLAQLEGDLDALLAALDPEPLAAEVDAFVAAVIAKLPAFFDELGSDLDAMLDRIQQLLLDHNPAALLQRFLKVLDVVREELEVLNPHTLAAQLDTIHAAARKSLEAYDPARLVDEVGILLHDIGEAVRTMDLGDFPADLPELAAAVDRVEAAVPTAALEQAGASLAAAGEALRAIDLLGLVEDVDALPARVQDAMHQAVRAVKDELIALLGALHYQSSSASGSVSV